MAFQLKESVKFTKTKFELTALAVWRFQGYFFQLRVKRRKWKEEEGYRKDMNNGQSKRIVQQTAIGAKAGLAPDKRRRRRAPNECRRRR
jgi:hypothetical protein